MDLTNIIPRGFRKPGCCEKRRATTFPGVPSHLWRSFHILHDGKTTTLAVRVLADVEALNDCVELDPSFTNHCHSQPGGRFTFVALEKCVQPQFGVICTTPSTCHRMVYFASLLKFHTPRGSTLFISIILSLAQGQHRLPNEGRYHPSAPGHIL